MHARSCAIDLVVGRALVVLLLLCTTPLALGRAQETDPGSHVEPSDLLALIESGAAPTIVDVRSRGEFAEGHVPGAIHVPFWNAFRRAMRGWREAGLPQESIPDDEE